MTFLCKLGIHCLHETDGKIYYRIGVRKGSLFCAVSLARYAYVIKTCCRCGENVNKEWESQNQTNLLED